jgi:hypothetical protein
MEGPGSKREERNRTWSIVIAAFVATILISTLVYLTFYTVVAEPQFVVGDTMDYEVSGSVEGAITLEVTEVNGTEFSVSIVKWTDIWADRLVFWYDEVDNASLEGMLVDTDGRETGVGSRMLDHYRYWYSDGAFEDVYMGPDNGVVYELYYTLGDYQVRTELVDSNVGWL